MPCQEYATPLGGGLRFHYKGFCPLRIELGLQVVNLFGQNPCGGKEPILCWEELYHDFEFLCEMVFSGDGVETREVIDSLESPEC